MIKENCKVVFFCPFKAEALLLASQIKDCHKINSKTWINKDVMIFTWNDAGFLPMHKFLSCFPLYELRDKEIVLFGSAGSVDSAHKIGQTFSLDRINHKGKVIWAKTLNEIPAINGLTVEEPVLSSFLRESLKEKHGICLIDLESFHFIDFFNKHEIQAKVLRFVSDTPDCPFRLPFSKVLVNQFNQDLKKIKEELNFE
ncbi:MAG: hypothetical protein Kow0029_11350 [Candidatus Rifleibacteriota bacterium]